MVPNPALSSVPSLIEAKRLDEAYALFPLPDDQTPALTLFNQGILAGKLGKLGESEAFLERARALAPGHADIESAAQTARTLRVQSLGQERYNPWAGTPTELLDSKWVLPLASTLAFVAVIGFLSTFFRNRASTEQSTAERLLSLPALLTGLAALLAGAGLWVRSEPPAILIRAVAARSGPADSFPEVTRLVPGQRVRFRGPLRAGWRPVSWNPDRTAWIPDGSALLLLGGQ